jgi:hypothetical protein
LAAQSPHPFRIASSHSATIVKPVKEVAMSSMWFVRWILIGLSAALAIVLIMRGNVVIGVLIGAMAVARAVLFVRMHHRRAEFRRRIAQRRGSGERIGNRAQ